MKNFDLWMSISGSLLIAAPIQAQKKAKEKQPNVIFIIADDLGYGDMSCYGAHRVQTPHVDTLASSGIRFTDAHAVAATSTPSRYSLFTVLPARLNGRPKKRFIRLLFHLISTPQEPAQLPGLKMKVVTDFSE